MAKERDKPEADATRRRVCQAIGLSACALVTGGAGVFSAEFLEPRALFEPATRFSFGPPDAFEPGSVITDTLHHVFLIREPNGFCALSSVCTHLGCITRYDPDENLIACPCHGSRFNLEGDVIAGPAPRPLHCLTLALSNRGDILVDTAIEVPPGTVFKL